MQLARITEHQLNHETYAYFVIVFAVLVCCFIGIATRPIEYLALLWPANAALLALFLRFPHLNNMGGWLGCIQRFYVCRSDHREQPITKPVSYLV